MFGLGQKNNLTKPVAMPQAGQRLTTFNHDGGELAKVKRRRNRYMPVWHVIFFVYFLLIVRLIAMADMGPAAYQNRIDDLAQGNVVERVAAVIMFMDPVSRSVAIELRQSLRGLEGYSVGGR